MLYDTVYDIVYNTPNWAVEGAVPARHRVPGTDMFMLPRDLQEDEDEDRYLGTPDPNDDADLDLDGGAPGRADPLDPLANFLKELKDLSSMSLAGPDIADLASAILRTSCPCAPAPAYPCAQAGGRSTRSRCCKL